MKMPSILTRKKLHATAARRPRTLGLPGGMDYEQMAEPNMKLSRALLIVLLLHIVAVAGIIAFNTIKTREAVTASVPEVIAPPSGTESSPAPAVASEASAPNELTKVTMRTETKAADKSAAPPKPAAPTSQVADSGKIYVVVRGDNPVTIARHLKVAEADLLDLNPITDPRKLQIGQKLRIPERAATTKHKE